MTKDECRRGYSHNSNNMAERMTRIETKVENIDIKIDDLKKQIGGLEGKFVLRKEFIIIVGILGAIGSISLAAIITILTRVVMGL